MEVRVNMTKKLKVIKKYVVLEISNVSVEQVKLGLGISRNAEVPIISEIFNDKEYALLGKPSIGDKVIVTFETRIDAWVFK